MIVSLAMMVLSMFCRCTTTRYVPMTEYHDRYINKTDSFLQTDSVWLYDSVFVSQRGDTVYNDRWHYKERYKYIYKNHADTLAVHDSIPCEVYVEKQLSKTDKLFLGLGKVAGAIVLMVIFFFIGWIFRKVR